MVYLVPWWSGSARVDDSPNAGDHTMIRPSLLVCVSVRPTTRSATDRKVPQFEHVQLRERLHLLTESVGESFKHRPWNVKAILNRLWTWSISDEEADDADSHPADC